MTEIVIRFDGLKMSDFRAYWIAVRRGDFAKQDAFFAKVVQQWPFELDPNAPDSYSQLSLEQYTMVQRSIIQASEALGGSL